MDSDLEQQLRLAEARASGIVSISADAIISIDENQRITLFNDGAEKIFGYTKEHVIGRSLDLLIPERFRVIHREHVKRFAAGQVAARRMGRRGLSIFGLRKNGEEFPADAAISKLVVEGQRILAVTLRDVTEQRRREHDQAFLAEVGSVLASSLDYERTLSSIAELTVRSLADVCIVDMVAGDGEVHRLTCASRDRSKAWACDLLALLPSDRTRPLLIATTGNERSSQVSNLSPGEVAAFAQSEEQLRALRAIDPKSILRVPLVVRGRLVGVLGLLFSTATPVDEEHVRLAEELASRAALSIDNARLYREAQRAIRARDDVLAIVAHDLRNPLNTIVMSASLVRMMAQPDCVRAAEGIERAATRMNRLIQDLLDASLVDAGRLSIEPTHHSVDRIVADAVEAQRSLASSSGLQLNVDVEPGLPEIRADRHRLLQVFENLISNAIKCTSRGGTIAVKAVREGDEVLFQVADTGTGIQPENLPHLFDRFWRARDRTDRGAGLGLAIVKGIVEVHGGRIRVESTLGAGATFFFTIPVAAG